MPETTNTVRHVGVLPVIRLDLSLLRGYLTVLLVVAAGVCIANLAGMGGISSFVVPFLSVVALMVASNLFTLISAANLTRLFSSLPVTRATVMRGHYLTIGMAVLVTLVPWLGGWLGSLALPGRGLGTDEMFAGFLSTALILDLVAILIPCLVKWGPRVGSLVLMGIVFTIAAVAVGLGEAFGSVIERLPSPDVAFALAGLVALLGYGISCVVSTKVYERQEH